MAKGVWLRRSDAFQATGLNTYQLDKLLQRCKKRDKKKHRQFFIQQDVLAQYYKDSHMLQEQQNDQILQQIEGNVDFNADDIQMQSINLDLKKARKDQILVKTKVQRQKLLERKRQLWYGWSQRFFQCFRVHMGKLKNVIIELHLNEEQVAKFNETLDTCLDNMKLNLNQIWDEFKQQNEENEQ